MDQSAPTNFESNNPYLSILQSKKYELELKKKYLLDLLDQLRSTKIPLGEDLVIDIGCGFWVKKSYHEALEFTQRQISNVSDGMEKLSFEIKLLDSEKLKYDEETLSSKYPSSDEPPLPFVEIQELLDENGEVIEAKLNDKPFLIEPGTFTDEENTILENHPGKAPQSDIIERHVTSPKSRINTGENQKEITEHDDQIDELLQDMEIIDAKDESGKITPELTNGTDVASQKDNPKLLEPKDIYELELIAGKFNSDDEESEEELDFDYDFDESDDESFDADLHSNFMSTIDTSILPGNSHVSERLRNEIIALRRQRQDQPVPKKNDTSRRVHFNDTLQIKEIENVSAELLNIEHKKQKLLRFKEIKTLHNQAPSLVQQMDEPIEKPIEKQRSQNTDSNEVVSDVLERNYENIPGHQEASPRDMKRPSKFRQRKSIEGPTYSEKALKNDETSAMKYNAVVKELPDESEKIPPFTTDDQLNTPHLEISSTAHESEDEDENPDTHMERLVKAYQEGNFDDDIPVTGPVVHKLDDFSILNKMIDSMSVEDTETKVSKKPGISYDSNSTNEVGNFSSDSSDEEIMTDFIVERELDDFANFDEDDNIHDPDQIEQNVIEREVTEQYQRLKHKLFSQRTINSEDQEYQDLGHISRFKSRKFHS